MNLIINIINRYYVLLTIAMVYKGSDFILPDIADYALLLVGITWAIIPLLDN